MLKMMTLQLWSELSYYMQTLLLITDLFNYFVYIYSIFKDTILESDWDALFNYQFADNKMLKDYILLQSSYTVSL